MSFEGRPQPVPAERSSSSEALPPLEESIKGVINLQYLKLLLERYNIGGVQVDGALGALQECTPETYRNEMVQALPNESGIHEKVKSLLAEDPRFVAYAREVIQSAGDFVSLAERLGELPGMHDANGRFYSGPLLKKVILHVGGNIIDLDTNIGLGETANLAPETDLVARFDDEEFRKRVAYFDEFEGTELLLPTMTPELKEKFIALLNN